MMDLPSSSVSVRSHSGKWSYYLTSGSPRPSSLNYFAEVAEEFRTGSMISLIMFIIIIFCFKTISLFHGRISSNTVRPNLIPSIRHTRKISASRGPTHRHAIKEQYIVNNHDPSGKEQGILFNHDQPAKE